MTKTFISRYTYAKERSHYPLGVGEQGMSIEYVEHLDHLEFLTFMGRLSYSICSRCSIYLGRLELISFIHCFLCCVEPMAF
jgi:hypothetical protein